MTELVTTGKITTGRCRQLLDLSRSHALRTLQEMCDKDLLKKIGKGRGVCYIAADAQ